jgi:hypothetical protein
MKKGRIVLHFPDQGTRRYETIEEAVPILAGWLSDGSKGINPTFLARSSPEDQGAFGELTEALRALVPRLLIR